MRRLNRSARKKGEQLRCTCPGDPRTLSDEGHEIHHVPCRSWCECCVRGRAKESPHLIRGKQSDRVAFQPVQMDYAFLHNTGDKDAKVTFHTMVDNSSGSMVAMAVQKKGTQQVC